MDFIIKDFLKSYRLAINENKNTGREKKKYQSCQNPPATTGEPIEMTAISLHTGVLLPEAGAIHLSCRRGKEDRQRNKMCSIGGRKTPRTDVYRATHCLQQN